MAWWPPWLRQTWVAWVVLVVVLLFLLGLGLGALWARSRRRPPAMLVAPMAGPSQTVDAEPSAYHGAIRVLQLHPVLLPAHMVMAGAGEEPLAIPAGCFPR